MTHDPYYRVRLGTDYTGEKIRRRDGAFMNAKRVTATCINPECPKPERKFECVITTKPPFYCPECKVVVKRAKRDAANQRRKEVGYSREPGGKKRRLIRYAGWDGSK